MDDATLDALKSLREQLTIVLKKNPDLADAVNAALYDSTVELKDDIQRIFGEVAER